MAEANVAVLYVRLGQINTSNSHSTTVRRPPLNFEQFNELLRPDMTEVDQVIRERLHSDVVLVRQVAEYIINSGGKRLRPALVILCAKALGYSGTQHHELAATVEFIHTATLLHDDVVDESALRRGRDTANALFGNAASVLVGDFLYSRAFQMMVSVHDMHVMEILSDATNVIAEGEVLQLMNCHDPDISEEDYLRVIRYKTAKLFEASGRLGAVIAQAGDTIEQALGRYGMHLGTAFQLIDDVLDYSGDKEQTGKNVGDDLAEGKPTLPLLYVMRHGSAEQAQQVRAAIEQGDVAHFDAILSAIQSSGALDYTRECARQEAGMAIEAISSLPDGIYREALVELCGFAVDRDH
jgi:octaprenyl-diphosphate synthase